MAQQFCTFHVADLFLGIEAERVQEVLREISITPVPMAPASIRGLINLRGQIVTGIDLRSRFDLPGLPDDVTVTTLVLDSSDDHLGLVVDRAGEVVEVEESAFEDPPDTLKGEARRLIRGAYKMEKRLLLVLDLDHAVVVDNGEVETGWAAQ
jgi:purine-binding chemotaxis protein CheW